MKNNIAILIIFTLVQISFCQTVPSKYGRKVTTSGDTAESKA